MLVKQISVFVENSKGKLSRVTEILAQNGINLRALSIADTTDFGILRLIVQDPEKAYDVLKQNGITVKITDVIVVKINDRPAALHNVLARLSEADIAVEYMYAFVGKERDAAYVIIKSDNSEKAVKELSKGGITVVPAKDIYGM